MRNDPTVIPANRLWTPWRMTYIGGDSRETGCVFCNRLNSMDDIASLIVHRARHAFIILNLYPYNTGHLLVVPNVHIQDPSELDPDALTDMSALIAGLTPTLRRVLNCDGFNIGMNIGSAAGAGIAEHLHQHVVPRWVGDANFMPITSSTKVLPELLPATYAKIRAEIARDHQSASHVKVLAYVGPDARILLRSSGLPVIPLDPALPVWRSITGAMGEILEGMQILGWLGNSDPRRAEDPTPAIALRATSLHANVIGYSTASGSPTGSDVATMSDDDRRIVSRGLERFDVQENQPGPLGR